MRVGAVLAAALAAAALAAPVAAAAPPALTVEATGAGYERVLTVQLQARKAKVRAATVAASATMNAPGHFMAVGPVRLARAGAGVFRGRLRFPMLGRWVVTVTARGPSLGTLTARVVVRLS